MCSSNKAKGVIVIFAPHLLIRLEVLKLNWEVPRPRCIQGQLGQYHQGLIGRSHAKIHTPHAPCAIRSPMQIGLCFYLLGSFDKDLDMYK